MKKMKRIIALFVVISILHNSTVMASNKGIFGSDYISNNGAAQTITTSLASQTVLQARGPVVAEARMSIINEGNGVLGGVAGTMCYVPVDRIVMRVFLDQFDENTENWHTLETAEYEYFAEDYEDGILTYATASFDIYNLQVNRYYRLSGLHLANYEGSSQVYTTETAGIKLTK